MQKIVNGIAIFSGVVALGVVGLGGYVFIRKDAIIDGVKEKVMDAVMPSIGGGIMKSIPDLTGPAMPGPSMPLSDPAVPSPMPKL